MRPVPLALAILVLVPSGASAQTSSDQTAYGVFFAATSAPALAFDALVITQLVGDEGVRKGFAINATIFGGVATTLGAIFAAVFISDFRIKGYWTSLAVGMAVVGAGSAVLGVYGMLHGPPPPPPEPLPPVTRDDLRESVRQRHLLPVIGISPTGAVTLGISGTL